MLNAGGVSNEELDELMDKNWQGLSQVTGDASYDKFDCAKK